MQSSMTDISGKSEQINNASLNNIRNDEINNISSQIDDFNIDEKAKEIGVHRARTPRRDGLENVLFKTGGERPKIRTAKKNQKDKRRRKSKNKYEK